MASSQQHLGSRSSSLLNILRQFLVMVAIVLPPVTCWAVTPKNVVVMAKSLDDLITLDPAEVFEFSGTEIIANLYDRLFVANPTNPAQPTPGLVESWSISEDGRSYYFLLKKGPTFQDGRPVSATDAVFSIRRAVILNKTPAFILSQLGLAPENIEEKVRAIDARQFLLEVDRDYAPSLVLNVLSSAITSVVDRQAVLANARDGDLGHRWLRSHSAGSGPFRLRRWNVGEYVMLDVNRDYPGVSPNLERFVIRDIREPATQRLMLTRGDVDIVRDVAPDQIRALAGEPGIITWSAPQARIFYIALNQQNPILGVTQVRQAIRYAIDYKNIVRHLLPGRAEIHQAFLPKGFLGALEEAPFVLDLVRARHLLMEAGYQQGFPLVVDVRSDPLALQIAQAIQTSFAKVGIVLDIRPGDSKQVLTKYRARRHDLYMGYWGSDYLDPHSNAAAFARNPDNADDAADKTLAWRNGWEIPGLTQRTDEAMLIRDSSRRAVAYGELQRSLQIDSPFIILFQEKALIAARESVIGFEVGLTSDQIRYERVSK